MSPAWKSTYAVPPEIDGGGSGVAATAGRRARKAAEG